MILYVLVVSLLGSGIRTHSEAVQEGTESGC